MFFYETARRTGIDRIAAMANRFGLGVKLDIDLPGARTGLIPTREWRIAQGKPWNIGDTVVHGIGQGYIAGDAAAAGDLWRARRHRRAGAAASDARASAASCSRAASAADWPTLVLPERELQAVRDGMWAVVNEPDGTAPLARLPLPSVQMAGKTGSAQVRRVSRAEREHGFNSDEPALGVPAARAVRRVRAV